MASSGSFDFTRTRDQIITRAFRICYADAAGVAPSSEQMAAGAEALNAMIKEWQADGAHLWKEREIVVYMTVGTEKYSLGTGGSRASYLSDTVVTALNGAHASGATSLTVDSTTGMTAADQIGVVLSDGTLDWTTIVSVDSTTTLTITAGLDSAASDNAVVYTYTSSIQRPLRLHNLRRRDWTTPTAPQDTPFPEVLSRMEYMALPNKKATGIPVNGYYDPQLSTGDLYIWPAATQVTDTVNGTACITFEDFDAATDTPDFPQEWINPLTWGLAMELLPEVAVGQTQANLIIARATTAKTQLQLWDKEMAPVQFQYDSGP